MPVKCKLCMYKIFTEGGKNLIGVDREKYRDALLWINNYCGGKIMWFRNTYVK